MGLFGDVDLEDIPEDPFFVEAGTYRTILQKWGIVKAKQVERQPGLSTQFTIEDEDADKFNGLNVSTYHILYPDATKEDIDNDPDIQKSMSYLRRHLNQMGVPPEDHGTIDDHFEDYLGLVYEVTVTNSVDKDDPDKKYSNISKIVAVEE